MTLPSPPPPASNVSAPDKHARWMQRCLKRARRGAGAVSPNPMVGAVLVSERGDVLGEGYHQQYGGPHAETHAIHAAEAAHGPEALRSATMYVNLEPCSHHGKTPPCTDLILEKGIPRLVIGMVDPFPAVAGQGIERLRAHGVDVAVGVLNTTCKRLNEAFIHHVETGRPLVTLKIAQTLDGHIATTSGDSQWISGKEARTRVHRWRSELDGVLVGSGTAQADDPRLTVRHVAGRQPVRLVLDRTGALPADLNLFTGDYVEHTIAVVGEGHGMPDYAPALKQAGGHVLRIPETEKGHLNLKALLTRLGKDSGRRAAPMQSLLVEAGPGLATALFQQDFVDRFFCFVAPKLIGEGIPSLHGLGIEKMDNALTFAESTWEPVGDDLLFRGYRRAM